MKINKALVLIAFILSSCSGSWHLKKAMSKDPSLFTRFADTITIPPIKIIDSLSISVGKPVIVSDNPKLKVNVQRFETGTPCDTLEIPIAVGAEYSGDTVFREKVIVDYSKVDESFKKGVKEGWRKGFWKGVLVTIILAVTFLLFALYRK